jgi:hypothetical protein
MQHHNLNKLLARPNASEKMTFRENIVKRMVTAIGRPLEMNITIASMAHSLRREPSFCFPTTHQYRDCHEDSPQSQFLRPLLFDTAKLHKLAGSSSTATDV